MTDAATPQPAPQPGGAKIIDLVVGDLRERAEMGRAKYGTYLQANNGREALVDAYQECLDQAMYLRQEITEARTRRLTGACDRPDCDRQRRELQAALTAGVEERRQLGQRLHRSLESAGLASNRAELAEAALSAITGERDKLRDIIDSLNDSADATWHDRAIEAEAELAAVTTDRDEAARLSHEWRNRAEAAEKALASRQVAE